MRRHLRQRLWARDGDPGPIAWAIASISLILPVAGLLLCLAGGIQALRGDPSGWGWVGIGTALIILDILIDFVWAHPGVSESDLPHLNRRADQLTGRIGVVAETIEGGRGKIRLGDTLWAAEGPDLPVGAAVRIAGSNATVLIVEAAGVIAEPALPPPTDRVTQSGLE